MGCGGCGYSCHKKSKSLTSLNTIVCIRDKVFSLILYLNGLQSFCNREMQDCVICGDETCAVLLKKKFLCIRSKKETLQKLIAQIDDFKKSEDMNQEIDEQESQYLEIKAEKIIEVIESDPVFSNHVKILKNNKKEQDLLKKALKRFEIDDEEIISEIKAMILEIGNEKSFKRYKYRRSKVISSE